MKNERGITLVALVIMVIIMLILAGVTLSLITGEEGLFARTNHSASLYKDASQKEAERVNAIINGNYTSGSGGEESGTTPTKPDIPEPDITPTYIPETNINPSIYNDGKGVKVEITDNTNSGYQLQYSTDEGLSWYDYIAGETEIYVSEYNGVVLAQLYDKATGTAGASATINVTNIDTLAPEEFSYTEGEKTENTITISGSTKDTVNIDISASSGIKYKYAIQSTQTEPNWESIEATTETEKTFDKVTGTEESLKAGTTYYVYMLAIDEAGNITKAENNGTEAKVQTGTLITELALNGTLKVGDYIEYDAGEWTDADFEKIRKSTGNPTVTGSKALPTVQGQFGGFEIGDSKNENSTPHYSSYPPRTKGWRVWNIDEGTGEVTIIHAGHPETYYHQYEYGYSNASINILRNRDCSMYENDEYAESGKTHFLMGWEAAEWYNKNFETTYELESYDEDVDNDGKQGERSFYDKIFVSKPVIEVLENGSFYYFASSISEKGLIYVSPDTRNLIYGYDAFGVRPIVSLKSKIRLEQDVQTDGEWKQWKIVGN